MPNPLIGYDDPQHHNHDPDEDVDEEWFQERDGWDQISLVEKKKKIIRAALPPPQLTPVASPALKDSATTFIPWQAYSEEDYNPTISLCS